MKEIFWSEVLATTLLAIAVSFGISIFAHFLFVPVFTLIQEGENEFLWRLFAHIIFLAIPLVTGWFLGARLSSSEKKSLPTIFTALFTTLIQLSWILFIDLFVAVVWQ